MTDGPGLPVGAALSASEFLSNLPRCVRLLETAVREVQAQFWLEAPRRRALEITEALSDGCKVCGFKETSGILRSLQGLLSLSYGDAAAIRTPLQEKLAELLAMLRDHARAASA